MIAAQFDAAREQFAAIRPGPPGNSGASQLRGGPPVFSWQLTAARYAAIGPRSRTSLAADAASRVAAKSIASMSRVCRPRTALLVDLFDGQAIP